MDVYLVLGNPCWTNDNGDTEIYGAWGSRRKWEVTGPIIPVIPTASRKYWNPYYVIVKYGNNGIAEEITEASELEPGIECNIPDTE